MRAKDRLRALDVRPVKERGQNFLIDETVMDEIVSFGHPAPGDALVEIGPGLGALTGRLYRIEPPLLIEIEPHFCADLAKRFPKSRILNADVRTVDFSELGSNLVVFGNLPYSFSTEIIFHLIDNRRALSRAVLMLQKEFADRMGAGPGGRDYGVLSISCQLLCDVRLGPIVPGTAFHPPTKVASRVLELTFLEEPRVQFADMEWLKKTIRGAFHQRRKKIHNSLKASGIRTAEQIMRGLADAGIDPDRRAETLSIEEFVSLAAALH